jgi:hypothetical protein
MVEHVETNDAASTIDWDDPHRSALADNPDKAEKLSFSTMMAVLVRTSHNLDALLNLCKIAPDTLSSFSPCLLLPLFLVPSILPPAFSFKLVLI